MMKKTYLILLLILLTHAATGRAQDHWTNIADTVLRYGPFQTYLFDTDTRRWLVESEKEEGYAECYKHFYDVVCQTAEKARQKGDDEATSELDMARLYMLWQQDSIDTDTALRQMIQIVDTNRQEHGDTTIQHVRLSSIMATILSSASHFAEAEQWCKHIDSLRNRKVIVYVWHNCLKLQAQMMAQVGQGRLYDAWNTAENMATYNVRNVIDDWTIRLSSHGLDKLDISTTMKEHAANLAPQLLMPLLPLPPSTFTQADIAPWPLSVTTDITSLRLLHVLTVINLQDLLVRIGLPYSISEGISFSANNIGRKIASLEDTYGISSLLSAELYRRTAVMASIADEQCDTIRYPHNKEVNTVMTRWHRCMTQEQLNFGCRSSVALLSFCTEWIKKGYPLSVLPLVEEAVNTMQRELTDTKPTQRMLLLQSAAHDWLQTTLPRFTDLVSTTPEYAKVIAELKALSTDHHVEPFS